MSSSLAVHFLPLKMCLEIHNLNKLSYSIYGFLVALT